MIFTSSYRTFDLGWGKTCAIAHFLRWIKLYHLSYFPAIFRPFWVIHGRKWNFPHGNLGKWTSYVKYLKLSWGKTFWPYRDSPEQFPEGFQCLKLQKHKSFHQLLHRCRSLLRKYFSANAPAKKKIWSRSPYQTFD